MHDVKQDGETATTPQVRIVRFSEIEYIRRVRAVWKARHGTEAHLHEREIFIGFYGGQRSRRLLAPWMPEFEALTQVEGGKTPPRKAAAAIGTVEAEAHAQKVLVVKMRNLMTTVRTCSDLLRVSYPASMSLSFKAV